MYKRQRKHGVRADTVSPGTVVTSITRDFHGFFQWGHKLIFLINKTPHTGSNTTMYVAASPQVARNEPGSGVYEHCGLAPQTAAALDPDQRARLWAWAEGVVGVSARDVGLDA